MKLLTSMLKKMLKFAEEKKMLEEILEINQMHSKQTEDEEIVAEVISIPDNEDPFDDAVIESYIKQNTIQSNEDDDDGNTEEEEEEAEVIDMENDDVDDDDVIQFYLQQSRNRSTRTGPMSQATKKTQPNSSKSGKKA